MDDEITDQDRIDQDLKGDKIGEDDLDGGDQNNRVEFAGFQSAGPRDGDPDQPRIEKVETLEEVIRRQSAMGDSKVKINYSEVRQSDRSSQRDVGMSFRATLRSQGKDNFDNQLMQTQNSKLIPNTYKEKDKVEQILDETPVDQEQYENSKLLTKKQRDRNRSLTTHPEEDESQNDSDGLQEKEEPPELFEGKTPMSKAWWIARVFFMWLGPLIKHTQKYGTLKLENYGDMRKKDKVDPQIEKLRAVWQAKSADGTTKNTLMFTIFSCYKWNMIYLMVCNFFSICLMFMQPFFLYFIIDFIKDGENKIESQCKFHDFSDVQWMKWLTQTRQYGLTLGLLLLVTVCEVRVALQKSQ